MFLSSQGEGPSPPGPPLGCAPAQPVPTAPWLVRPNDTRAAAMRPGAARLGGADRRNTRQRLSRHQECRPPPFCPNPLRRSCRGVPASQRRLRSVRGERGTTGGHRAAAAAAARLGSFKATEAVADRDGMGDGKEPDAVRAHRVPTVFAGWLCPEAQQQGDSELVQMDWRLHTYLPIV